MQAIQPAGASGPGAGSHSACGSNLASVERAHRKMACVLTPNRLTVESAGERSNIFSSVLGATIIRPYPNWHPKLLKAYFTRNTQDALQSFDYKIHKSAWADIARSANEHNDPGNFTTFIGYEFTTSTDIEGGNLGDVSCSYLGAS